MRINKLFSNYGICSRKEVNKFIEDKRIKVNGEFCQKGQWIEANDEILFDGKKIEEKNKVYIAFNKPVGITTTSEKNVENNIIDYINYAQYIFPVGRLDKDSEGLILLTNDGDLANKILDSENNHEKEYIVKVNKKFDDKFLDEMSYGVNINGNKSTHVKRVSDQNGIRRINGKDELISLDEVKQMKKNDIISKSVKTKACRVSRINDDTFKIILTQGLNRQIRKMTKSLGYTVINLKRIRIMNIELRDLEYGKYRDLKDSEILNLKESFK